MDSLKRYTGRTSDFENFVSIESLACGCCGEALFDQPFANPKKTMQWFLLPPPKLRPVVVTASDCYPKISASGHIHPTHWQTISHYRIIEKVGGETILNDWAVIVSEA